MNRLFNIYAKFNYLAYNGYKIQECILIVKSINFKEAKKIVKNFLESEFLLFNKRNYFLKNITDKKEFNKKLLKKYYIK